MKRKLLTLILCFHLLAGLGGNDGEISRETYPPGFINITVESNVNRLYFKYDLKEWCLSATEGIKSTSGQEASILKIKVPVKDFKSTDLFVYRDFLELLKAEQFPYLEIAIPHNPDFDYYTDNLMTLNGVSVTVAGVTKQYDITSKIEIIDNQNQILNGTFTMKLTDLEIDPPVKWAGLVKVRNEIIVKFAFCFRNT